MTELSVHIPRELAITAESIIEEQQIPLLPAERIGRGTIHPDRIPPSIPTLTQVHEAIIEHEGESDPHPQYAKDTDLSEHTSDQAAHIPSGGITNTLVATDAAIEWSKISKVGAVPSDIGAMPALGTIDQQIGSVKPTVRSTGAALQVGDRWLDTVDRLWWFWNGAYWLSEILDRLTSGQNVSSTTNLLPLLPRSSNYNVWLDRLRVGYTYSATNHNSTDNFTTFVVRIASSKVATVLSSQLNSQSVTGINAVWLDTAINLHVDVGSLDIVFLGFQATKNGAAPTTTIAADLSYRLAKR
jgi:hypothetical protein